MVPRRRRISTSIIVIVIFISLVVYSSTLIKAQLLQRDRKGYPILYDCEQVQDQATPSYASPDKSGILDVKVKCIGLSMAIVYILLVSAFLRWGFFYRRTERTGLASTTTPLLSKADSFGEANDDTPDMKEVWTLGCKESYPCAVLLCRRSFYALLGFTTFQGRDST